MKVLKSTSLLKIGLKNQLSLEKGWEKSKCGDLLTCLKGYIGVNSRPKIKSQKIGLKRSKFWLEILR